MTGFIQYFLNGQRKSRSIKRSFLGNLCRNISCSGSRERKHKRAFTPKNKSLEFKDFKAEPVRPKKAKIDKTAARRKINLNYRPEVLESDQNIATASRSGRNKQRQKPQQLEVKILDRKAINSENDTYSVGISTQGQKILFRTLDDNIE
jgi:hypothetical protein